MSGVKMIQDNTKTCLNNLERSLLRCKAFLQHRCIPKECAQATSVRAPQLLHLPFFTCTCSMCNSDIASPQSEPGYRHVRCDDVTPPRVLPFSPEIAPPRWPSWSSQEALRLVLTQLCSFNKEGLGPITV